MFKKLKFTKLFYVKIQQKVPLANLKIQPIDSDKCKTVNCAALKS